MRFFNRIGENIMKTMIKFESVTKEYPNGFRAVDQLCFDIYEGEFIVLIGPSGCGKTTTMKMINGLQAPTDGVILVDGEDIRNINEYELRRKIGYVIQDIGLLPHMTIEENIGIVPKLLKWDKEKIKARCRELLELVGLDPDITLKKYPKQLSGGQKQRVGVARALAVDPPIMLMDEPFGALDPITREQLQDEFIQLQKKMKKTIVFVTHDMDEAIKFADRIIIMNAGKIVQIAKPLDMLQQPKSSFVTDFIGNDNAFKQLSIVDVSEVMNTENLVIDGMTTVEEAKQILSGTHKEVIVKETSGTIIGYLRMSHCAKSSDEALVKDVCGKYKVTVNNKAKAKKVLSEMIENGTNHAMIIDEAGEFVGHLTMDCFQKIVGNAEE